MEEERKDLEEIGLVTDFFSHVSAAAIQIDRGSLKVGDKILIQGHTTNLEQVVDSMQIEKKSVEEANAGDNIGIKVSERVRKRDKVFKVI
ncbi:MAG: translation elongation factor-like protein [Candidatus Omnitrophica bacterium]|nr:translation elongation factor-like protein [Candidatus Omnitrophota bacterium]